MKLTKIKVRIKAQDANTESEPLISELSYVIMRLHRDMNLLSTAADIPITHEVIVHRKKVSGTEIEAVCFSLSLLYFKILLLVINTILKLYLISACFMFSGFSFFYYLPFYASCLFELNY